MNGQERLESLSPLLEGYIHEQYFSAAVVGITEKGVSSARAWGKTANDGEQLEVSHLFDLASLTKLFTTAAVLRLIDAAVITDRTRVLDVLRFSDPILIKNLKSVTIASLLTHASGLCAWYPLYTRKGEPLNVILRDVLVSQPRLEGVVYSDLNYMLLGMLVGELTNLPLDEAMHTLVFGPLNLKSATYHPDSLRCVATEFGNRIEKRMVADLGLQFDGWRSEQVPLYGECNDGNGYYYFGGVAGHAGIFADCADVLALGSIFNTQGSTFISPDLLARTLHDWGGGRGYGIQYGALYPNGGYGHTGFTGTYLYINAEHDMVITLLANRLHAPVVQSINSLRIEVVSRLLAE